MSRQRTPRGPRPARRPDAGESVVVGYHAVLAALENTPRRVERLLVQRGRRDARMRRIVALAREAGVPFRPVPVEAIERLARGASHQGVAARLAGCDLLDLDDLLGPPAPSLLVVLDGVEDPRNVGAVARTAAAVGAGGLVLPGWRSAGVGPGALKTAAGAFALLPVARAGNAARTLETLREAGLVPVGLDVRGGVAPWEVDLRGPVALVAGGEARGLRPSVLGRCEVRVRIPVAEAIGSLNVSVAVGMVLAELLRQRGASAAGAERPRTAETEDAAKVPPPSRSRNDS